VSSFLDHSSLAVTSVYLRRLEGETDRTWPDVAGRDRGVGAASDPAAPEPGSRALAI